MLIYFEGFLLHRGFVIMEFFSHGGFVTFVVVGFFGGTGHWRVFSVGLPRAPWYLSAVNCNVYACRSVCVYVRMSGWPVRSVLS